MDKRTQNGRFTQTWLPVGATLLLAPSAGELLTSSTPPAIFFRPAVFIPFLLLYGGGALLARELAVRWGKGWGSVLILGLSYGVIEEGLCAKSFFDPHWRALGSLGQYGRWMGVNWLWALGLTGFHAVFTIGLTIFCVYLIFPQFSSQAWLGRAAFWFSALLFTLDVLLFIQKGNSYEVPRSYSVVTGGLALLLAIIARRWSARSNPPRRSIRKSPFSFAALGFLSSGAFIFLLYFFPLLKTPALFAVFLLFALAFVSGSMLMRWTAGGQVWELFQRFGLLSGVYGFFALLAPFQDFNVGRPDPVTGMTGVGAATLIGLALLYRKLSGPKIATIMSPTK